MKRHTHTQKKIIEKKKEISIASNSFALITLFTISLENKNWGLNSNCPLKRRDV